MPKVTVGADLSGPTYSDVVMLNVYKVASVSLLPLRFPASCRHLAGARIEETCSWEGRERRSEGEREPQNLLTALNVDRTYELVYVDRKNG